MKFSLFFLLSFLLYSCFPQKTSIYSQIEYEAGACFGFCPIFKITIQPDKSAVIEAERFTFTKGTSKADFSKPKEGTFKTTITPENFRKLIQLLNAADLKSLKSEYKNKNVSDLPTAYLRIKYVDGTVKNIEDYGKNGTPKLDEIYQFMENLRFEEDWKKVE